MSASAPYVGEKVERNAEIVALLRGASYTLQEVADLHGITRERVRQIANNHGVTTRNALAIDPLAILRTIRTTRVQSFGGVANQLPGKAVAHADVRVAVAELGMTAAVQRLFRWRKASQKRAKIRALIYRYTRERDRLGRPLSSKELMAMAGNASPLLGKNYVAKLRQMVGETANVKLSRRYGQKGYLVAAILTTAASPDGCTVEGVVRATGSSRQSVQASIYAQFRRGRLVCERRGNRHAPAIYRLSPSASAGRERAE